MKTNNTGTRLFIKQGIKSTLKNKLSLFILIILTLLSTSFLSAGISAFENIDSTFKESFEGHDEADYFNNQKMFYTDNANKLSDQSNSFTPVYDILPSYILMNPKDFSIGSNDSVTTYALFINNDKAIYNTENNTKNKNNPLLLNPFSFLYNMNSTTGNWLGLNDDDVSALTQIQFENDKSAIPVENLNINYKSFTNFQTTINNYITKNLMIYINDYIYYIANPKSKPNFNIQNIQQMENSIFKYSLIAKYINKNILLINDKESNEYKNLNTYINYIASELSHYITNILYNEFYKLANPYISAWNNGYYLDINENSNNKTPYDLMQEDINGELTNGINKENKPLPLSVAGATTTPTNSITISYLHKYTTGLDDENKTNDNDPMTSSLFNKNTYDENQPYDNINENNLTSDYQTCGTKGISEVMTTNKNTNTNLLTINDFSYSIVHYAGYSYNVQNSNYEYYELHKYYAANISNFTFKNSLTMLINQDDKNFTLMSYKEDDSLLSNNQESMDIVLYKGSMPRFKYEVIISPAYAKINNINVGDTISIAKKTFLISGIGISPLQLYPMIDYKNISINPSSEAILYTSSEVIKEIASANKNMYTCSDSTYYKYEGNDISSDILNLDAYTNFNNNLLNYSNSVQINLQQAKNNSTITQKLTPNTPTFESTNIPKYEKTLFSDTDKMFLLANIIVSIIILIVTLIAVIIITKNNIEKDFSQIALLKAIGVTKKQLITCYTIFASIILLFIPIGFFLGLFLQFIFINDFASIFSIMNNKISIGWISFIITFGILGIFTILTGILVSNKLINKSTVLLLRTNVEYKKTNFSKKLDNFFYNKSFNFRFKISLASASFKKIIMLSVVMLFAAIAISFSLILPVIINTMSSDYTKVEGYSNSNNYVSPVFNLPISKMSTNIWAGQEYLNKEWVSNDDTTNTNSTTESVGDFKSIDDYYKINSNSSLIPPFINDQNKKSWTWTLDAINNLNISNNDILKIIMQGVLNSSGKSLGLYTFDQLVAWMEKFYPNNQAIINRLNSFEQNSVTSILKSLFNYTDNGANWRDVIIGAVLNSLPSSIDTGLQSPLYKELFSIGWNYVNYNPTTDTLITNLSNSIKSNNKSYSISEMGLPENQNVISFDKNDSDEIFNNLDEIKKNLQGSNSNNNTTITIPVIASQAAKIHDKLSKGQIIDVERKINELQFKTTNGEYGEIDPSWWQYDTNGTLEPLNSDESEFNGSRTNYNDDLELGYAKWNDAKNQFTINDYYNPKNIVLKIPKDEINLTSYIGPYKNRENELFDIDFNDSDDNYYYFRPFNLDVVKDNFQEKDYISAFTDSRNDSGGWYSYAVNNNILKIQNYDEKNTWISPDSTVNHNQNIKFKIVNFIKQYNSDVLYMDQSVANLLNDYSINKMNFFNYEPSTERGDEGKLISENNNNQSVYSSDYALLSKDNEPYSWYNGKLSTSVTPDFQNSFGMNASYSDYSSYGFKVFNSELQSYTTLNNVKGLLKIATNVGIAISLPILLSIIICSVILIILITTMFIDQNINFMILMKALGYHGREIMNYIFSIFTPIFILSFIIGYIFVMLTVLLVFFSLQKAGIAVPYEYKIWTLFVSFGLVLVIYIFALIITNYRIRKMNLNKLTLNV